MSADKKMKHDIKIPLMIIGAVVILAIILNIRACIKENRVEAVAELQGQFDAYKTQMEKQKVGLEGEKEAIGKEAKNLSISVTELKKENEAKEAKIKNKSMEVEELKRKFDLIPIDESGEQVLNLQKQVGLLEREIKEKDDLIKGFKAELMETRKWEVMYNRQSEYIVKLEKQLLAVENLLKISEEINDKQAKQIGRLKTSKRINQIVAYPLAIFGGYKLGQAILGKEK